MIYLETLYEHAPYRSWQVNIYIGLVSDSLFYLFDFKPWRYPLTNHVLKFVYHNILPPKPLRDLFWRFNVCSLYFPAYFCHAYSNRVLNRLFICLHVCCLKSLETLRKIKLLWTFSDNLIVRNKWTLWTKDFCNVWNYISYGIRIQLKFDNTLAM